MVLHGNSCYKIGTGLKESHCKWAFCIIMAKAYKSLCTILPYLVADEGAIASYIWTQQLKKNQTFSSTNHKADSSQYCWNHRLSLVTMHALPPSEEQPLHLFPRLLSGDTASVRDSTTWDHSFVSGAPVLIHVLLAKSKISHGPWQMLIIFLSSKFVRGNMI